MFTALVKIMPVKLLAIFVFVEDLELLEKYSENTNLIKECCDLDINRKEHREH